MIAFLICWAFVKVGRDIARHEYQNDMPPDFWEDKPLDLGE